MELSSRVDKAMGLAATLHRRQTRRGSGVPYVSHLWAVAGLVAEMGGDEDEIIAAILHDSVEDQGGMETLDLIRQEFSDHVANVVLACSDAVTKPKPPWHERKEAHLAHLNEADDSVLRVVLADKIHNARTIVIDQRESLDRTFDRFTGGKHGTLWYYRSMVELFRRRMPNAWTEELSRLVEEMHRLADIKPNS